MTEVSFYHLQHEPLEKALPRLLEKVSERGLRALVRLRGEALCELLDGALWTFSAPSFLPHGTAESENAAEHPILLTLEQSGNGNGATVLVLLEDSGAADVADFDRCLYMFDGNDDGALSAARQRWRDLKEEGLQVAYWQQGENGWEKKA